MRLAGSDADGEVVGAAAGFGTVLGFGEGQLVEGATGVGGIFLIDAGLAEVIGGHADGAGNGADGEVAEGIGSECVRHFLFDFGGEVGSGHEVGGEQFADGAHVDAVEAGSDDRRAGDTNVDFAGAAFLAELVDEGFHRRRADDGVLDEQNAFAFQDLRQGGVFDAGFVGAVAAFDEGAADVAVAEQAFETGDAKLEGHAVGGRLSGVWDGNDDCVAAIVDAVLKAGEFLSQLFTDEVDAAVVEGAGDVGEVDPFEKAVGTLGRLGEALHAKDAVLDDCGATRGDILDGGFRESEIGEGDAFAGGTEEWSLDGVAEGAQAKGISGGEEVAGGVEENDVVGTVEAAGDALEDFDEFGTAVAGEFATDEVH